MLLFQTRQFLKTDCVTSKFSSDGTQQGAVAIRAEHFQERCKEADVSPIKPSELRTAVQAYGIGKYISLLQLLPSPA